MFYDTHKKKYIYVARKCCDLLHNVVYVLDNILVYVPDNILE